MSVETWRLRIEHVTTYRYPTPITASFNELRMQPRDEPRQWVMTSSVTLEPNEGSISFVDYFGNSVMAFDLHRPHTQLRITVVNTVEVTSDAQPSLPSAGPTWDAITADESVDEYAEYLVPRQLTALSEELQQIAADIRERSATPAEAAAEICRWTHDTLTYTPGVTHVHTDAAQAFESKRGVCQDFSHLAIGMLRACGIPARYVSGYLHPQPDAAIGETVPGESHAWVEYLLDEWQAFDPTNGTTPGVAHVVTGRGRDYRDVPPIRGLYSGHDKSTDSVEVRITRLR